ncbi:MAG: thioredoxin family protein [Candidatus Dormibacteria bacterium]
MLRLALFAGLLVALPGLYLLVRLASMVRRRRVVGGALEPGLSQGEPTLLFFTGEQCSICKYRQKPAIESLRRDLDGALRVVELDAAREDGLVRRFNVLSLPTTVLLAPDGRVGAVNYGFAPGEQLRAQIAGLT